MQKGTYFISGIDTDAGKSYATGYLAKSLMEDNIKVTTQKLIQTGNKGYSEDIELHRRLMGIPLTEEDKEFLTMPEIYSYPASPHLAAEIDQRPINFQHIEKCTQSLAMKYDIVLLEGAGGLMVPLTADFLTIDYIVKKKYPLIFVTSGKLGSINHTLLSLEAIKHRNISLYAVLYNLYSPTKDSIINEGTLKFIKAYLENNFPQTKFMEVPILT